MASILAAAAAAAGEESAMDDAAEGRQIEVRLNVPLPDILARLAALWVDSDDCKIVEVNTTHLQPRSDEQLARFLVNASAYKAVICKYATPTIGENLLAKRPREESADPVLGYAVYLN